MESVQHLVHLISSVHVCDHWIAGGLSTTATNTHKKVGSQKNRKACIGYKVNRIQGHCSPNEVAEESNLHDFFWADRMINQSADDHGNRESEKPQGIKVAQIFCRVP